MGTGTVNSKKRYIKSLTEKHRELDKQITNAPLSMPDEVLKEMKVKKLDLKQEITSLEAALQ